MKAQFGIDEALADSSKSEAEEYMGKLIHVFIVLFSESSKKETFK